MAEVGQWARLKYVKLSPPSPKWLGSFHIDLGDSQCFISCIVWLNRLNHTNWLESHGFVSGIYVYTADLER
jgi:hypothetical protein